MHSNKTAWLLNYNWIKNILVYSEEIVSNLHVPLDRHTQLPVPRATIQNTYCKLLIKRHFMKTNLATQQSKILKHLYFVEFANKSITISKFP